MPSSVFLRCGRKAKDLPRITSSSREPLVTSRT
jgi:hypothetical protein